MSHAPIDILKQRHQAIRRSLAERHLDALVVTALPNILYLTNFTGSSAIVVLTADRLEFITDFRYVDVDPGACSAAVPELELTIVEGSYDATLVELSRRSCRWRGSASKRRI